MTDWMRVIVIITIVINNMVVIADSRETLTMRGFVFVTDLYILWSMCK